MTQTLLIDTNYLCHRAHYALNIGGGLMFKGSPTSVLFGVCRDITNLMDRFVTNQLVFCFDLGPGLREQEYSFYKATRRGNNTHTPTELKGFADLRKQIEQLRTSVLSDLGFVNIHYAAGYEADDVIASIATQDKETDFVIVSADSDLYQLLAGNVIMYNPRSKKSDNRFSFRRKYNVWPHQWPMVKALSGCKVDNIPGVPRVGPKTAIKFINNELYTKSKAYLAIKASQDIVERNLKLVKLPYTNCPEFTILEQEEIDLLNWREVMSKYGIKTLSK